MLWQTCFFNGFSLSCHDLFSTFFLTFQANICLNLDTITTDCFFIHLHISIQTVAMRVFTDLACGPSQLGMSGMLALLKLSWKYRQHVVDMS